MSTFSFARFSNLVPPALFASALLVACAKPAAAPTASAAPADSSASASDDDTSAAADTTESSDTEDKPSAEAVAASAKAKTIAKQFKWTQSPTLDLAPKDASVGGVGDEGFATDVSISVDKKRGEWTFRASEDAARLGPSVDIKGEPKPGKYIVKFGHHPGYFQAPDDGKTTASKFEDTTSVNDDNAYAIELTKVELGKDGKPGKASGRYVIVFDNFDGPKLWAAGSFTDATLD